LPFWGGMICSGWIYWISKILDGIVYNRSSRSIVSFSCRIMGFFAIHSPSQTITVYRLSLAALYYSQNITMTLFTLLLFCACCFICRLYLYTDFILITARCTLVQSAVLRSHVVCLSVRPSVCLAVCL